MKSVVMEGSKLREEAHQIFDWVKSFAEGAEIEIGLGTNINEGLRFGNNELSQSQYSRRRALSVRVVTNKRQARATTGLLEKSKEEKTVRKAFEKPWNDPRPYQQSSLIHSSPIRPTKHRFVSSLSHS